MKALFRFFGKPLAILLMLFIASLLVFTFYRFNEGGALIATGLTWLLFLLSFSTSLYRLWKGGLILNRLDKSDKSGNMIFNGGIVGLAITILLLLYLLKCSSFFGNFCY